MRWEDERYVRLYTRDTASWMAIGWEAQALFMLIMRKVDRAGVLELGKTGTRGLSGLFQMPIDVVERAIVALLEDGCIERVGANLVIPNYIEAQEASMSPNMRQKESRLRRRDMVRSGLDPNARETAIYFIQSEHGGPVKIGMADDVARRLVGLQTSRPDKLVILGAFPGTVADERALHSAFASAREKGEWFTYTSELASFIATCVTAGELRLEAVTCHETRPVTLSRAVPCLAVPNQMLAVAGASTRDHAREISPGGLTENQPVQPPGAPVASDDAALGCHARPATENASAGQKRTTTGHPEVTSATPIQPAAPTQATGPDLLTMAGFLAERQCQYGQDMLNRAAAQKTLTKSQREKIRELYAEYRERADLAERAKGITAAPQDPLQAWASQRWVAARKKRGLGAQEPDQRHIAELCRLATVAVAKATQEATEQGNEAWVPEAQEVVAFWIRLYLAEIQTRAGGVADEGFPLAWLPGKCREYLLPKRSDVRRGEVAGPASDPEARASPVATVRADADAPGHTTIPPDMCQRVAQLGANSHGVLRRRSMNI
jgi:Meiotically up-regulated gene 113